MEKFKLASVNLIWFLLCTLPFLDIANGILLHNESSFDNGSQIVKGLFLTILFCFWLTRKQRWIIGILGLYFFSISVFHAIHNTSSPAVIFSDILFFAKVLSFPLAIWGIKEFLGFQDLEHRIPKIRTVVFLTWVIYALSATLTLFGFGETQYLSGGGMKGYFYGGNEFALSYFVISALLFGLLAKDGRPKMLFSGVILILVSFVIGLKTAILGTSIAFLLAFFLLPTEKIGAFIRTYFWYIPPILVALLLVGGTILKEQNFFYRLQFLTDKGALSFITGERSPIAQTALTIYQEDYTWTEKLFGIGKDAAERAIGNAYIGETAVKSTEMDPIDLLLNGGIVSLLIVFGTWLIWGIISLKKAKSNTPWNNYLLGISLLLLLISSLAGHVIYSGIALFYIALLFAQFEQRDTPLIVFVGPTSNGGMKTYIEQTAKRLKQSGMRVQIVNTHYLNKIRTVLQFPYALLSLYALALYAVLSDSKVIFHFHAANKGSYLRKLLLALLLYPFSDMHILHLHSGETGKYFDKLGKSVVTKFSLRLFLSLFDKTIVVSQTLSDTILSALKKHAVQYKVKSWIVLTNAIDLPKELPTPAQYDKGDVLNVLFVGRFEKVKNLPAIIEVAKQLKQKNIPVKLTLVGDGSEMSWVRKQIEGNQLDNITLLGWVSHPEIDKTYATNHVFIIPSKFESFGIVVLEAYIYGLPAIASKTGGLCDIVKNSMTGFVVDTDDISGYVETIETYCKHPEILHEHQKNAQLFVREFNYPDHIKKLHELYLRESN